MTTTVLVIDVYVDTYLVGYGQYPSSDIIQEGVTNLHPLTLYMGAIRSYRHVLEPKRVREPMLWFSGRDMGVFKGVGDEFSG
jgi:hypothetical protein